MTGVGRLIVVANRLPVTVRRVGTSWRAVNNPGGLVSALDPVMRERDGLWIGWPGEAAGRRRRRLRRGAVQVVAGSPLRPVDLPTEILHGFYEGYSNQTLWPLFHQFSSRLEFDPADWDAYVRANERFRDTVLEHLQPGDLVWIHDYHLMLLPGLLREACRAPGSPSSCTPRSRRPTCSGPAPTTGRAAVGSARRRRVAFHTHDYLQHFRHSLLRILGLGSRMDCVDGAAAVVSLEAHPIGIAPDEFADLAEHDRHVQGAIADLRQRFDGQARAARRRPPRLHEGHPGAAPHVPQPARAGSRPAREGRAGPGRRALARGASPTTHSCARR